MLIDLKRLDNGVIDIDEDFTIDYKHEDIVDLNNLHVKGTIAMSLTDMLEFNLSITGNMVLKDSVSLDDVNYPLDIKIEEEYDVRDEFFAEYYKKEQNTLDILPVLWQNIVLEVPMRYTTVDDATLSGDGWSMGIEKKENIDPRLAELEKLLGQREE